MKTLALLEALRGGGRVASGIKVVLLQKLVKWKDKATRFVR